MNEMKIFLVISYAELGASGFFGIGKFDVCEDDFFFERD